MNQLAMIIAIADDGTIGIDGKLPWSIPEDLHHFKKLTTNHAVIIGGAEIYRLALPRVTRLYVTEVHRTYGATSGSRTVFAFDRARWREVERRSAATVAGVEFVTLEPVR